MEFDKTILFRNLDRILKERNLTQKEFCKSITYDLQPDVYSKMKHGNTSVPVEFLFSASQYLNISIDELVGNTIKNHNNDFSLKTLIEKLFEIEDLESLDIDKTQSDNPFPFENCIVFSNEKICSFLSEWKEAIKMRERMQSGKTLYQTWKQGILKASSDRLKSNNYLTEREIAHVLGEHLLSDYEEYCNHQSMDEYSMLYLPNDWGIDELVLIEQYADDFLKKHEIKEALKIAWEKIAKTQPQSLFIIPDNPTT